MANNRSVEYFASVSPVNFVSHTFQKLRVVPIRKNTQHVGGQSILKTDKFQMIFIRYQETGRILMRL